MAQTPTAPARPRSSSQRPLYPTLAAAGIAAAAALGCGGTLSGVEAGPTAQAAAGNGTRTSVPSLSGAAGAAVRPVGGTGGSGGGTAGTANLAGTAGAITTLPPSGGGIAAPYNPISIAGAGGAAPEGPWTSSSSRLVAELGAPGEGLSPDPVTSDCSPGATFTFVPSTSNLTYSRCELTSTTGSTGSYRRRAGTLTLTEEQYSTLVAVLQGVSLSSSTSCGADKPVQLLTITDPVGTKSYYDDFYACSYPWGTTVTHVDEVLSVLFSLTRPPEVSPPI